jgi:hypothetical protein
MQAEAERLLTKRVKTKRHARRKENVRMNYPVFEKFYTSLEGGSHSKKQALDRWAELEADRTVKRDLDGIVEGTPHHRRLSIPVRDMDLSDTGSEEAHEHIQGTKEKKGDPWTISRRTS